MVRGRRAASKKCCWDEGLAPVPAIFGPNQPAQAAAARRLAQGQSACGEGEITRFARFSAFGGACEASEGAFDPLPLGRMTAAADGLEDAAQHPGTYSGTQFGEAAAVYSEFAGWVKLERIHAGLGQPGLGRCPDFDGASRRGASAAGGAQSCALEAGI